MKKYLISFVVLSSAALIPLTFADTTTGTGTTGTGSTGTGIAEVRTTGSGVNCMITGTGLQTNVLTAQVAFSDEMARLVAEKQAAYQSAQSLTGSTKVEAIKSANVKFRTGLQAATRTLNSAKKDQRSQHMEIGKCKKTEKQEVREVKKEKMEEIKSKIHDLKQTLKDRREARKEDHNHQ